ncbi:GTPase Era, partial [bacterium]
LLVEQIVARLPERPPIFAEDEYTDQTARFLTSELVREKILQATRQEVPHAVAVRIDQWDEEPKRTFIRATIVVEKASQRAILIGKKGQFIKTIGTAARIEIEKLVGRNVFLELFVKVEEGWRQNPRLLHELEYDA